MKLRMNLLKAIALLLLIPNILIAMESDDRLEDDASHVSGAVANNAGDNNDNNASFDDREPDVMSSMVLFRSAQETDFKADPKARSLVTSLVIKKGAKEGEAQSLHAKTDELVALIAQLENEKHDLERECEEKKKVLDFQKAQISGTRDQKLQEARSKEAEATAQLLATLQSRVTELALVIEQTKAQKDSLGKDYLKTVESREQTLQHLGRAAAVNPDILAKPILEEVSAVERERQERAAQEEAARLAAEEAARRQNASIWQYCIIA